MHKLVNLAKIVVSVSIFMMMTSSCSSLKRGCYQANSYKMKNLSVIQQPLTISKTSVSNYLFSAMPEMIFKGGEKQGLDFDIEVKKLDVPHVSIDGQKITLQLPLLVHVTKKLGFMSAVADGEILLEVGSDIDIDENWNLLATTELDNYSWTKEPELKLMGMKIPVTNLTNKLIEQNKDMMTGQIDQAIGSLTFLKEGIVKLLERLKSPVALGEESDLMVNISPIDIGLADFSSDKDVIQTVLQMKARVDVVGMDESKLVELDEMEVSESNEMNEKFVFHWIPQVLKKQELSLSIDLTDEQIQFVVDRFMNNAQTEDLSFEIRKKMVEVTDVKILMKEDMIGANVYLEGGYRGSINYMARPSWNNSKKKIVLCSPELSTNIKGGSSNLLLFFFKKAIKKQITKEVETSINEILNDQLQGLNERIDDLPLSPKSKMSASMTNLKVQPIKVEDNLLRLDLHMSMVGEIITNGLVIDLVKELD